MEGDVVIYKKNGETSTQLFIAQFCASYPMMHILQTQLQTLVRMEGIMTPNGA